MTKRYDETAITVNAEHGLPTSYELRGHHYDIKDIIGRWRIEGRWWADGRDREYWRVETLGGAVWDLYHDRKLDTWHVERMWD